MSTPLSYLITRLNFWTPILTKDDALKVNALDSAIRDLRRSLNPQWTLKKTTLRIFSDVLEYPLATDHAALAILDSNDQDKPFGDRPRYVFTSIRDFYEDPTYRNDVAEIWNNGTKYLGVRNTSEDDMGSTTVDEPATATDYTVSGDGGTPVIDSVFFKTGSTSVRIPITASSGTFTVTDTPGTVRDTNYKRSYYFRWVYFDSAPTSVTLKFGADASNYLEATITAQFSGSPFVADDWNLLAFDLNTATETGTVTGTFAYESIAVVGHGTGNFYMDASYMKRWKLQDYWYYSSYNVSNAAGTSSSVYFAEDGTTYTGTDVLLGDSKYHDVIIYQACVYLLADSKEEVLKQEVKGYANAAYKELQRDYPDLSLVMTTNYFRFQTDYQNEMGFPDASI